MREPQPLTCTQLGTGPPILVLYAYGMQLRTYLPLADELAHRARVVIPDLFALSGWWDCWDFEHTVDCLRSRSTISGWGE
jgi:hypothetical protein